MSPIHWFEFCIISLCVNSFSIFTYIFFYYDLFTNTQREILQTDYDFIIIGAGTAGSLIAHRLATETNYTFVVLEAGGNTYSFHEVPVFSPLLHGSVYDWQYETVPQENACFAMENHKCKQTQGKVFGGSSKLNNMIHIRGNLSHYVDWFHHKYNKEIIEDQFHYLETKIFKLSDVTYRSELTEIFLNAAKELGYKELYEAFGNGVMKPKLTQNIGKRWTTSDNKGVFDHTITNVLVEKLLIENDKCVGVKLYPDSKELYAGKGVIVTAGTLNTPKILQLSGIGPADVLSAVNIPVIKDLPVGKNLQDHIGTGFDLLLFSLRNSIETFDIMEPLSVYQYYVSGKGVLTMPGCEAVGFFSTKDEAVPDIQFMFLPVGLSSDRGSKLKKTLGIVDEIWQDYFSKIFHKSAATIFTIILHPKSRGEIYVQSKDPDIPPVINPRYLSDNDDVKTLRDGLKLVRNFINTNSMQMADGDLNDIPLPGCQEFSFFSDEYLDCYIKYLSAPSFHPVGTCSMGLPNVNTTVVDTSFKVLGIDNLYVADGSVLPTLPSANINAAIAMMASMFFEYNIKQITDQTDSQCHYISNIYVDNSQEVCPIK